MCGEVVALDNALAPAAGFFPGDLAELSCRLGYKPEGDMTSQCLDDQTWSSPTGSCFSECFLFYAYCFYSDIFIIDVN